MPLKSFNSDFKFDDWGNSSGFCNGLFFNGYVNPSLAGPLAIGIVAGAALGSKIMPKLPAKTIRLIFIPVILIMALQMLLKGLGVSF